MLRKNIIFRLFIFLVVISLVNVSYSQGPTITSLDEQGGDWSQSGTWTGGDPTSILDGTVDLGNTNITIAGTVYANSISFITNTTITINSGDTLIVSGGFSISGGANVNFSMNGTLIVNGDLTVESGSSFNLNGNSGFLGVTGNFTNNGGGTYNSNGSNVYILGTATSPMTCSNPSSYSPPSTGSCTHGDQTALLNNEGSTTVDLLLGAEPFTLTLTPTNPSCNGASDGSITAVASGGSRSGYVYSLNGNLPFTSSGVFSGLPAGDYTVYAQDNTGGSSEISELQTLSDPAALSFGITADPYKCSPALGEIIVNVTDGSPDYTVSVTGQTNQVGAGPDYTFSDLPAGTYSINVTDQCGATPPQIDFEVKIDVAAPTVEAGTFPGTYESSLANFSLGLSNGVSIAVASNSFTLESGNLEQTLINNDYSFYNTLHYSFDVNQLNGPAVAGDQLSVLVSFDNGTIFSPVNVYSGVLSGIQTGSIALDSDPTQNTQVIVKLVATIVTSGLQYSISSCTMTGDERFNKNAIDDATGGVPTFLDDVSGISTAIPNTSAPTYYCTSGEEFTFTRSWTVTDNCGRILNTADQIIRVGESPTIDMSANAAITIDSCYRATQNIAPPTVSDNCSAIGNINLVWVIHDSSGDTNGSGNIMYTFLPGEQTTIDWIATDEAGFSTTETQTVDVLSGIFATFTVDNTDICLGGPATFTLNVTGGTGAYSIYEFTPTGGTWVYPNYTTSGLALGTSALEVVITDDDDNGITGGCQSTTLTSGNVYIHENFPTNTISR